MSASGRVQGKDRRLARTQRVAPRRAGAGMSLLEILLVVTVLSLVMLPILGLLFGHSKQASQSIYLLNAHTHLMGLLHETEGRLHAARFDGEAMPSQAPRSVTTVWAGVEVPVEEEVRVTASSASAGVFVVEASLAWRESRGHEQRTMRHRLVHLLCDPAVGQELP